MKKTLILAILSACFGAPAGFCTANAAQAEAPAAEPAAPAPADNSELGLLCKGAGVDPDDVRWRVAAGLDVKQAVDAAIAQKEAKVSKKGGK